MRGCPLLPQLLSVWQERARQFARDNESDKQMKKREARELAEAHELLRLQEEAAKKALHDKRMEALMDPDRDPSMPLPLDPKEGHQCCTACSCSVLSQGL